MAESYGSSHIVRSSTTIHIRAPFRHFSSAHYNHQHCAASPWSHRRHFTPTQHYRLWTSSSLAVFVSNVGTAAPHLTIRMRDTHCSATSPGQLKYTPTAAAATTAAAAAIVASLPSSNFRSPRGARSQRPRRQAGRRRPRSWHSVPADPVLGGTVRTSRMSSTGQMGTRRMSSRGQMGTRRMSSTGQMGTRQMSSRGQMGTRRRCECLWERAFGCTRMCVCLLCICAISV